MSYPDEPTKWQLGGGNVCAVNNIRHEVGDFAIAMEQKLRKNDHKTGWKDQPIEAHIRLLRIEMMEFDVALEFLGDEEACKECVDIANFALIIRDKLRARIAAKKESPPGCSCHPDDNPPKPCPRKHALNDCRSAAIASGSHIK